MTLFANDVIMNTLEVTNAQQFDSVIIGDDISNHRPQN